MSFTPKQQSFLQWLKTEFPENTFTLEQIKPYMTPATWPLFGWLKTQGYIQEAARNTYKIVNLQTTINSYQEVTTTQQPIKKEIPNEWKPFLVGEIEEYIEQDDEIEDVITLLQEGPVLITGIKGIGKSLLAANIAKKLNIPRFILSCSKATDEEDVLGRYVDLGTFVDGVVTKAVRCAQDAGRALLVLEEVNAMQAGVSFVLHNLLDFNKMLVIPSTGEVLKVNGNGKLFIIATANMGYFGTLPMNQAFRSRFNEIHLSFPSEATQRRILRQHIEDGEVVESIIKAGEALRKAAENHDLPDFPSIREEVMCTKLFRAFSNKGLSPGKALSKAFTFTMAKFAEDNVQRETVKNLIRSASSIPVEFK
ncbi:MAG: AAA family ATPase [Candidatus Bathyarchaeota archaeon]|nr:AAA family ATPase [Candidatus Bathyarchaeota archaeon]